ncbi:hypothetical protein WJ96_05600 [Burkholderia ubonensis]|uniref:Uncharacterized protein n=1 Tax=Burkholderia ubonensis TaxID=101571 RepID=A0AAW3MR44_9BURK|nr:hypothetical protein [Burkholderia ubonensis]KVP98044.1 hypothetical protein WJ96_05600 [Burkholderia ubonensis]KVZ92741.1 hypothetical protein WL25_17260 [Burkholderia ubonensis]
MSHQGMSTPHPDWLSQVKEVTVKPEHAEGRSETGAALAAIADEMGAGEPFAAGEVMGVVLERGATGTDYAVMVSSGNARADVARIAKQYAVEEINVSLMSAAVMLEQQYQGLANCTRVF